MLTGLPLAAGLVGISGCGNGRALAEAKPVTMQSPQVAEIEGRIGGRVGAVLLSGEGQMIMHHRVDERFAMCSTFKAPLAAAAQQGHNQGKFDWHKPIELSRDDLVPYAPYVEARLQDKRTVTLFDMATAAVTLSDNAAANIVLRAIGGPAAFTAFVRSRGDNITRLDRIEPDLNENARGDVRDTTTPGAMARLLYRLLIDKQTSPFDAYILTEMMRRSQTGANRIRAGLPAGWKAGTKTGTAPPSAPAYNETAIIFPPERRSAILSVYIDRPAVSGPEAEAAIASIARHSANLITEITPKIIVDPDRPKVPAPG